MGVAINFVVVGGTSFCLIIVGGYCFFKCCGFIIVVGVTMFNITCNLSFKPLGGCKKVYARPCLLVSKLAETYTAAEALLVVGRLISVCGFAIVLDLVYHVLPSVFVQRHYQIILFNTVLY